MVFFAAPAGAHGDERGGGIECRVPKFMKMMLKHFLRRIYVQKIGKVKPKKDFFFEKIDFKWGLEIQYNKN